MFIALEGVVPCTDVIALRLLQKWGGAEECQANNKSACQCRGCTPMFHFSGHTKVCQANNKGAYQCQGRTSVLPALRWGSVYDNNVNGDNATPKG